MLNSFKSKAPEPDKNPAANADELIDRTVRLSQAVVEKVASGPEPTATKKSGRDSCVGADMSGGDRTFAGGSGPLEGVRSDGNFVDVFGMNVAPRLFARFTMSSVPPGPSPVTPFQSAISVR